MPGPKLGDGRTFEAPPQEIMNLSPELYEYLFLLHARVFGIGDGSKGDLDLQNINEAILGSGDTGSLTIEQFNQALIDGDFATLTGTETLENKTLTTPVISGAAPSSPAANVLYSDLVVKGWVETSGGGAWTIDDHVNVSSISDNGTGDFTVNWVTAFANDQYVVMGCAITTGGIFVIEQSGTSKTTTSVNLNVISHANALTDPATGVSVIAIGRQ